MLRTCKQCADMNRMDTQPSKAWRRSGGPQDMHLALLRPSNNKYSLLKVSSPKTVHLKLPLPFSVTDKKINKTIKKSYSTGCVIDCSDRPRGVWN